MSYVPSRAVACGCLALSMTLVGSYVALSKPLVAAIPVFLLAWLRFGIGGLAMLHWLRRPATEPPPAPRTRRLLFLESFLGNFLFSVCMLFGVSMTSAVSAGVIMASIPAVVAVLSGVFLRERISGRTWTAIALAAAGIVLLALAQPHAAGAG
ncbi:MAG TPA: DMT family transporter, partial [Ramlibacter sp.]|nr:DMT family transporter [Ramlibacter sp.]